VGSVGVRPCWNVWMQSFLFLLRSCLSFFVAVLTNPLLSGVRSRCQPLQSLLFPSNFCLINIGQSYVLSVYMFWCCVPTCPLYCIVEVIDCCFNIFFGFKGNI
jgi:hypothetical protein